MIDINTEKEKDAFQSQTASEPEQRLKIFLHACAFVFGFGLIFTLLGSAAGMLGRSSRTQQPTHRSRGQSQ